MEAERGPREAGEHGVGRGEEEREQHHDRRGEQQAAQHRRPRAQPSADASPGSRLLVARTGRVRAVGRGALQDGERADTGGRRNAARRLEHPRHQAARDPRAGERGDGPGEQGAREQHVRGDEPRVGTHRGHRRQHQGRDRQPRVGRVEATQGGRIGDERRREEEHGRHDECVQAGRVARHGEIEQDADEDGEEQDAAHGDSGHRDLRAGPRWLGGRTG